MNFKSIFSAVALSALMVGCSSDDIELIPDSPTPDGGETTSGYMNIAINLPSVGSHDSRAGQVNDSFDDGLASEYAVTSAHLVLFNSDDETTAQVRGVFTFNDLKPWNTDATIENVTTSAKSVIKVDAPATQALGALVVLNDPKAEEHFPINRKFKDLFAEASVVSQAEMINGGKFFMTNAPIYKNTTGKTLATIRTNQIYNTYEAALQATPIEIFVERGVAKVNVTTAADLKNDVEIDGTTYQATVIGWSLDITNKKSYMVRNIEGFDTWKDYTSATKGLRFYSTASNRIYWAIDPNYDDAMDGDDAYVAENFNKITMLDINNGDELDEPVYVLENTFGVANQRRTRTTRAIIKASFAPEGGVAKDFYQVGSSNTIYNKEGMRTVVIAQAMNVLDGKTDKAKYKFNDNTSVSASAGAHKLSVGDVLYDGVELTENEIETLNDAIGTINFYKDGVCYYVARIQHFGDEYTPWKPGDPTYGETLEGGKEQADRNYLGRYGVVRNNWYELQISEIKHLGNPDIPVAPNTPDDENEYYVSFKVNVHAWAKRVQNVIL